MTRDLDALKKIIGNNIKKYRKQMRYTQKDLGIQSELNDVYISQLERGVAIPSNPCFFKISSVLKTTIEKFFI